MSLIWHRDLNCLLALFLGNKTQIFSSAGSGSWPGSGLFIFINYYSSPSVSAFRTCWSSFRSSNTLSHLSQDLCIGSSLSLSTPLPLPPNLNNQAHLVSTHSSFRFWLKWHFFREALPASTPLPTGQAFLVIWPHSSLLLIFLQNIS